MTLMLDLFRYICKGLVFVCTCVLFAAILIFIVGGGALAYNAGYVTYFIIHYSILGLVFLYWLGRES